MAKGAGGKGKRRSPEAVPEALALAAAHAPAPPVWQRALGRLTGARACYGKPVEAHGHVVIPVATLRTVGGLGYGAGPDGPAAGEGADAAADAAATSSGGGGGGMIDARPIGFIDIGPEGVRYQAIHVPPPPRRFLTPAVAALGVLVAARLLRGSARGPGDGVARLRRRASGGPQWPVRSLRR